MLVSDKTASAQNKLQRWDGFFFFFSLKKQQRRQFFSGASQRVNVRVGGRICKQNMCVVCRVGGEEGGGNTEPEQTHGDSSPSQ